MNSWEGRYSSPCPALPQHTWCWKGSLLVSSMCFPRLHSLLTSHWLLYLFCMQGLASFFHYLLPITYLPTLHAFSFRLHINIFSNIKKKNIWVNLDSTFIQKKLTQQYSSISFRFIYIMQYYIQYYIKANIPTKK